MVYHMYKWDFNMFNYKRIMISKSKKNSPLSKDPEQKP
jgi:hypothetical protein